MTNIYADNSLSIGRTPLIQLNRITAGAGATVLAKIEDAFGGWEKAAKVHFADGGTFDQIYAKK